MEQAYIRPQIYETCSYKDNIPEKLLNSEYFKLQTISSYESGVIHCSQIHTNNIYYKISIIGFKGILLKPSLIGQYSGAIQSCGSAAYLQNSCKAIPS